MHNEFKFLLQDKHTFDEIGKWLNAEKQIIINSLSGMHVSENLQRLSGSLRIMNHLIYEIEKEKPKR